MWISLKIPLKFVPKGPINNIPALVQIMAWRRPGDKPLSEPMLVFVPTHICVTRPQWVKYLEKNYRSTESSFSLGDWPTHCNWQQYHATYHLWSNQSWLLRFTCKDRFSWKRHPDGDRKSIAKKHGLFCLVILVWTNKVSNARGLIQYKDAVLPVWKIP